MADMTTPQMRLLQAIQDDNVADAARAVNAGAKIDYHYTLEEYSQFEKQWGLSDASPLFIAGTWSKAKTGAWLVEQGADALELKRHESTLHHIASVCNAPGIIKAIAAKGFDIETPHEGQRALTKAIESLNPIIAKEFLEAGASPNCIYPDEVPPLFYITSREESLEIAKMLFAAGADIYYRPMGGRNAYEDFKGDAKILIENHVAMVTDALQCKPGDGAPPFALIENGKPTKELLEIAGAHLLPELFSESRWRGHEREALELYDRVAAALPTYYKDMFADLVDMAAIRRSVEEPQDASAVERYVRKPKPPIASEGRGA